MESTDKIDPIEINNNSSTTEIDTQNKINYCKYEDKKCSQRCFKNYNFCIRHILCDKNAPFKQCKYTTLKNGISMECSNAIVKDDTQIYCNKHLCTLGLKEKKKSNKPALKSVHSKANDMKPISKQFRVIYNHSRHTKHLLNFVKKSITHECRYIDDPIELLYRCIFGYHQYTENYPDQYEKLIKRTIVDNYRRNLKLEQRLNERTEYLFNLVESLKPNNTVDMIYNTSSTLLYEHDNSKCSAKVVPNELNLSNKCMNKAIVGLNYCTKHIKSNKKQMLFTTCNYKVSPNNELCGKLVVGKKLFKTKNNYCVLHATLLKEQQVRNKLANHCNNNKNVKSKMIHTTKDCNNDGSSSTYMKTLLQTSHTSIKDRDITMLSNGAPNNQLSTLYPTGNHESFVNSGSSSTSSMFMKSSVNDNVIKLNNVANIPNRSIQFNNDNPNCPLARYNNYPIDNSQSQIFPNVIINTDNQSHPPYIPTPLNINTYATKNEFNANNLEMMKQFRDGYTVDQFTPNLVIPNNHITTPSNILMHSNFKDTSGSIQPNCFVNSVRNFYHDHNHIRNFVDNNHSDIGVILRKPKDPKYDRFPPI